MRTKTHRRIRSEQVHAGKIPACPFRSATLTFSSTYKSFDLMKLRAVRRIHFIAPIRGARRDDANRRRRRFHRANLHGRSVRAEQPAVGQDKKCPARFGPDDPAAVLSASKQCHSSSTSGPSARANPMRRKISDRAIEHLRERMKTAQSRLTFPAAKCRCWQAPPISLRVPQFFRGSLRSPR